MSEETQENGMSSIKKTIIGVITTAATAAGAYVTTHIEAIFGGDEEEVKTEQVQEAAQSAAQPAAPFIINIENTNQQKQSSSQSQPTKVIERVVEKPAPATPAKPVEDEDPW